MTGSTHPTARKRQKRARKYNEIHSFLSLTLSLKGFYSILFRLLLNVTESNFQTRSNLLRNRILYRTDPLDYTLHHIAGL